MTIQAELGLRIRNYRKQNHLSQEKLAELCALHPTYIGQIERGEKNATIESLYHIARGLNVPLSKLVEHLEDVEVGDGKMASFLDIYRKIQTLPPEKQEQMYLIIDAIISISTTDT